MTRKRSDADAGSVTGRPFVARGLRLEALDDKLVASPASQLIADDRAAIRFYKPQLLAAVKIANGNGENGTSQQHIEVDEPQPQCAPAVCGC